MSWKNFFRFKKTNKQEASIKEEVVSQEPTQVKPSEPVKQQAAATEINEQLLAEKNRLEQAKNKHREGQIDYAFGVYLDVIRTNSKNADAQHMAGVVCLQRGQLVESERYIKQAIELDNNQADYYSNLGNVLGAQNKTEEALNCFKQAITLNPQNLAALSNAASASLSLGKNKEAQALSLKALELVPHDIDFRLILSSAYLAERENFLAIDVIEAGLKLHPNHVELLVQLANLFELVNKIAEAKAVIEQIDKLQPGIAQVSLIAGTVFRRQGEYTKAVERLKLAISQGLSEKERIEVYNQLGLALDSLGEHEQAFDAFTQSNQSMAKVVGVKSTDGQTYIDNVKQIRTFFSAEKLSELNGKFNEEENFSPVFFVGFPRSGTTLMEQVLKAHPKVVTTDELSPISLVIDEIRALSDGYPNAIDSLTNEDVKRLRVLYIQSCQDILGDISNKQVVDKLPLNIAHLGLAKILFPQSKVIVALRDPRDSCLSCFMQKFDVNAAMANFLSIETTGAAYQAVMDLWLHYRSILSDDWMEYRYEDLVEDFDKTLDAVLDFVGLAWDEQLNSYRQSAEQRTISTPSYRDVTAPINNKAVERWRHYEKPMASILPILAPFVEAFSYQK